MIQLTESLCLLCQLLSSFATGPIVAIIVGPQEQLFHIHKQVLVDKCPYFAFRLKDCWDGKIGEPLKIEDVNVEGFKEVVNWLYSGTLPQATKSLDDKWSRSIKSAYKVADQLAMTNLQNMLIDSKLEYFKTQNVAYTLNAVRYVWDAQLSHTPYYQMVLKSSVRRFMTKQLDEEEVVYQTAKMMSHPQAVVDVLRVINEYNKKAWINVAYGNPCEYHIHPDGKRCDGPST